MAKGERPRFDMAHRSYAVSSVIASATFLEAAVSELFQDPYDKQSGYLDALPSEALEKMAIVWRATELGRSFAPIEKWQSLLECAGQPRLAPGAALAQDALLLVRLRSVLVHFKPENVSTDEEHALEKNLRGKFRTNGLMTGSGNAWWPSHGLGYGCTEWAVRSARVLADDVLVRLGIVPNYQRAEAAGGAAARHRDRSQVTR